MVCVKRHQSFLRQTSYPWFTRRGINCLPYIAPPLLPSSAWSGGLGDAGLLIVPALPEPAAPPLLISTIVPEIETPVGPMSTKLPDAFKLSCIPASITTVMPPLI